MKRPAALRPLLLGAAVLLGLSLYALRLFVPYTFLRGDSAFYITMQRGLLESGWLEMSAYHPMSWYSGKLPHYAYMDQAWSNLALGADGHSVYPKHPWLLPLAALPLYALLGPVGSLIFNLLGMAALLVGGYLVARRFCGSGPALIALLPVALSGLVLDNTYTVSNDVFYSALLALGVGALALERTTLSATLLALAVVAKPTDILWLPAPFVVLGSKVLATHRASNARRWSLPPIRDFARAMHRPAIIVGLIGGVEALLNWHLFGSPLHAGYHRILVAKGGHIGLESAADAFNQPLLKGLVDQLTNRWQGLWPAGGVVVVAAVAGLIGAVRCGPASLWTPFALAVYLLIYARYDYVWSRFYLPVLVLAPLGLAAPFARSALRRSAAPSAPEPRPLRRPLLAGAIAWVGCLVLGLALHRLGERHTLAECVTEAKVTYTTGAHTWPCDYLNPNTMHWECSRLEGEYWQGWGPDIRGECRFSRWADGRPIDGRVPGLYFLHPPPAPVRKTITWADLGPLEDLRLFVGYGAASRGRDADLRITLDGRRVPLPTFAHAGVLHAIDLPERVTGTGAHRLEIRVRAGHDHQWRHLCVGARLVRP